MDASRMHITIRSIRKPKRFRSAFTTEQIKYLELQFKKFPYISSEHRKEIATNLNMQERAVKIWFQNRRMKEKKESISKEPDYETTNKAEESGKNRLDNTCTVTSVSNQLANSLSNTVKPLSAFTNFPVANTSGIPRETQENFDTQEVPQNLSMNHMKSPTDIYQDLNDKHQVTFLDGLVSTQSDEVTSKQFKNRNPQIHRKPVEVSMDLSKKLKKAKKEINQDHKVKVQKKLELHPSMAVKSRISIERMPSKKKIIPQVASRLSKQAKTNEPTYFPIMPTMYAHPYISSGGVIWKPINIMPVVTPGNTIPVPNPQQNFGHAQKNNCGCNCHGNSLPLIGTTNVTNPYAQYVFTASAPYQNSNR